MPWPTYSERLVYLEGADITRRYTLPEGYRGVVKNILIALASPTASQWGLVKVHGILVQQVFFQATPYAYSLACHVVFYGGESVEIQHIGQGVNTMVSGFIFEDKTGANQPPGAVADEPIRRPRLPTLLPAAS